MVKATIVGGGMLILRELKEKDAEGMLSWMHDDSINSVFAADFKSFTLEKVIGFINTANEKNTTMHFACVNENDEYLGTVSLKNIDYSARNAEYAISFCKLAQGTGAATFATDEILKLAFDKLKLERVYLNVITENKRANGFYKKYGFVFEGEFKNHILVNGELKDLSWYRMLRDEYIKNKGKEEKSK